MQFKLFPISTVVAGVCLFVALPVRAQDESRRFRSGQVKVGDRILADPTNVSAKDTCTVLKIRPAGWRAGYDGDYEIKCDHNAWTDVPATGDHVELMPQGAAGKAPAPGPGTGSAPAAPPRPMPAAAPAPAAPAPNPPAAAAGTNAFGTRDPRPCPASNGGTPSAALAAELVACAREGQTRNNAGFIVSDVKVTSMVKSTYNPYTQTGFTNMDTSVAPIAISGSLQSWMCSPQDPPTVMAKYSNAGKNCMHQPEPHATGYCYKLRTGSWSCSMVDTTVPITDKQFNVAPPK